MQEKLLQLKKQFAEALDKVKDETALRELEIKYLGRKGDLTVVLRNLADLSAEAKKETGQLANNIKLEVRNMITAARQRFDREAADGGIYDITMPTLPKDKIERGHLHPISRIQYELEDLFTSMGFMVLDGPELESDYFNFEALNIPYYHPARDLQDTFYLDHKNKNGEFDLVMRTQTSPMQVRAMLKYGAPLRCVVPGRIFRNEASDAKHENTFNQIEGLLIGENISVANLVAVLKEMLSGIMNTGVELRIRPGYFPFTEPSLEIDMRCTICGGEGCASCKYSGWMEMLGSGMVHPNVLRAGGIDPAKWSGFAFGLGIDRLAMMKYGINDIRLFNSGDLRFLNQF